MKHIVLLSGSQIMDTAMHYEMTLKVRVITQN